MIRNVDMVRSPIGPGERRKIRVDADGPVQIAINCFTDKPPPPGYKPCDACGTINIQSGEVATVTADQRFFSTNQGYLVIDVKDLSDGDTYRIRISAGVAEPEGGGFAVAG